MKLKKRKVAHLGSVSEGTLLTLDLVTRFCDTLRGIQGTHEIVKEGARRIQQCRLYGHADDLKVFLEDVLFPAMEDAAPPYTWFGMNEGDGAAFGYWPAMDNLEEDARNRNGVAKVAAGDPWENLPEDTRYVMEVTDHGNVTLRHRSNGRCIWSVV